MASSIPIFADRVKETTTTTGTGTLSLGGAPTGFRTFVAGIGSANSCWYACVGQGTSEWEVGIGTVTTGSPATLSRDTILASSNSGSAVSFSAGTKDVYCDAATDAIVSTRAISKYNYLHNSGFVFDARGRNNTSQVNDVYVLDRWYLLTQTAASKAAGSSGNTLGTYVNVTQTQVTAQRLGLAQIIEAADTKKLWGQDLTLQARFATTGSLNVRMALLGWTGTADTVTSDVVNDWTSGTYTISNFFSGTSLSVIGVSQVATTASVGEQTSLSGTITNSYNNLIVFFWTESTAAQNAVLTIVQPGLGIGDDVTTLWQPSDTASEEMRCQRFCRKLTSHPIGLAQGATLLYGSGGTLFSPSMRSTPTLLSGGTYAVSTGSAGTVELVNAWAGGTGFDNSAANWSTNAVVRVSCTLDADL